MRWFCPYCKSKLKHNEKYDCYYCDACNDWQEKKCNDPHCEYCAKRPEKPIKSHKKRKT